MKKNINIGDEFEINADLENLPKGTIGKVLYFDPIFEYYGCEVIGGSNDGLMFNLTSY